MTMNRMYGSLADRGDALLEKIYIIYHILPLDKNPVKMPLELLICRILNVYTNMKIIHFLSSLISQPETWHFPAFIHNSWLSIDTLPLSHLTRVGACMCGEHHISAVIFSMYIKELNIKINIMELKRVKLSNYHFFDDVLLSKVWSNRRLHKREFIGLEPIKGLKVVQLKLKGNYWSQCMLQIQQKKC